MGKTGRVHNGKRRRFFKDHVEPEAIVDRWQRVLAPARQTPKANRQELA